jgi:hypothetical protein
MSGYRGEVSTLHISALKQRFLSLLIIAITPDKMNWRIRIQAHQNKEKPATEMVTGFPWLDVPVSKCAC